MRIALNLSTTAIGRERLALAWAIPAVLLGAVAAVFVLTSTARAFREGRAVQKSLAERLEQEKGLRAQEANLQQSLEQPQIRDILDQVRFVNTLIEKKQFSLTELVTKVAELLPEEASLKGLSFAPHGDNLVVRIVVTGRNEEAVETFLSSLEDSPDFKEVAITSQGFVEESGAPQSVTVACSARYQASAPEEE